MIYKDMHIYIIHNYTYLNFCMVLGYKTSFIAEIAPYH